MTQKASVSPQYLLEGAAYALEQCGLLLRDANLLYRSGSYASAVALAAFAREGLGRWKILRDLRKKVLHGDRLTIKDIQTRCDNHVRKQEAGMLSTVLRADRDTGLDKLIRKGMTSSSEEWRTAKEQLEELSRQKAKRGPGDRHKQRMSALYVDAVAPDRWNRPTTQISQRVAFERLQDAADDYRGPYDRYTDPENHKPDDPDFYSALEQWSGRPTLPRPESP